MSVFTPSNRQPKPMKINGNWFIDLDEFIDVQRFSSMHDELSVGVAMSMQYSEPVVIGSLDAQFDSSLIEVDLWLRQNQEDPHVLAMKANGATYQQLYDYVKYSKPTLPLGRKILLRTYKNYHGGFGLKHLARLNTDQPAYKHFSSLRSFLDDSAIFKEIGRIIIFVSERGAAPEIHCDYADGQSRKDQFIWLNPNRSKKFFVLDENFEKQYLTGICNTFDSASWHGGDAAPTANYTIRVDGVFSRSFLEATNLGEHFAREPNRTVREKP